VSGSEFRKGMNKQFGGTRKEKDRIYQVVKQTGLAKLKNWKKEGSAERIYCAINMEILQRI